MKHDEAKKIIQDCLENTYSSDKFESLVANILTAPYKIINNVVGEAFVREAFRDSVSSYVVKGIYDDPAGKKIAILEVRLRSDSSLQHARTMQRNFVADFLKGGNNYGRQDGALVAFVGPSGIDWRFSLVKMDYSIEVQEGKIKTHENLTPAKRWSFLIEKGKNHTAISRLLPLVMEESHGAVFAEIENAFDVESVTDEFFEQYKECFFRFKDEIDRVIADNDTDRTHFESIGLDTANFAKKTLGQIAFLYFLQKKGWFGVASDKKWGDGPKDFLRKLFERKDKYGKNFFNDVLEPLFYEALATDRGELAIYTRLNNTRVPFLNGGLFEPMKGYEWEKTNLTISDEIFSNTHKTKNGDIGDGILDVFDRYNFTVSEDEPLEKEVAVDPEMLGKIFENLLEIRDRKSKGAFYTPRPIVHYMCQQSLIEYLINTDLSIPREDIEFFIQESEITLENDRITRQKIEEARAKGREYKSDATYQYKTPVAIRENASKLDHALATIRIADPAVGSGAFPLGMINEIVRARQILAVHAVSSITSYQLKLHAIQENIYGVDLDPGAVEICQLRLWLSLIVDESEPHPLPNLNYRIVQGNSLIEEYEGIRLYDPKLLSAEKPKKAEQSDIFSLENSESNRLYELLQNKLKRFIETSGRTEKENLKREIDNLKFGLIEATLHEQNKDDKIREIRELREANTTPFFLWKLEFSEVFQEKGGFDIVIGNPPYIEEKDHKDIFQPVAASSLGREFYQGKMNFFFFFFHLGLNLSANAGTVHFITTNYYITSAGGKKLRKDMKTRSSIYGLINFDKLKIFKSATGQNNIITFLKKGDYPNRAKCLFTHRTGLATPDVLSDILHEQDEKTLYFEQNQDEIYFGPGLSIRTKVDKNSKINFGKVPIEKLIGFYDISQGVVEAPDKVSKKVSELTGFPLGKGIFVLTKDEVNELNLSEDEKKIIKKYLHTEALGRYSVSHDDEYLIFSDKKTRLEIAQDKYPHIKKHLDYFSPIITSSNGPYGLHRDRSSELNIFERPKLICKCMFDTPEFTYDEEGYYVGFSFSVIWQKDTQYSLKYLLGLMNSKLGKIWFHQNGKRRGVGVDIGVLVFKEFPVPKITLDNQSQVSQIIAIVDQILESKKLDSKLDMSHLEKQIDKLVYGLYGLTEQEIRVVEGN